MKEINPAADPGLFESVAGKDWPELPQWSEAAWVDVIRKMDEVYADLIRYEVDLERKNQALEDAQQFISGVISSISDVLVVCNARGRVLQVNRALEELIGQPETELKQRPLVDLFVPEHRALVESNLATIRTQPVHDCEVSLRGRAGAVPLAVNCTARCDQRGKFNGMVLIGRPVGELRRAYESLQAAHHELKRTQQQLIHSEKLASLGRLIAGVAHELNNPIGFVYSNVYTLLDYGGKIRTYFDAVGGGASLDELRRLRSELRIDRLMNDLGPLIDGTVEGVERMRHIVQDLRRYSSGDKGTREPIRLDQLVDNATRWATRGARRRIELVRQVPQELVVLGYEGHLHQVIVNLVQNALDAMEQIPAPRLTIGARREDDRIVVTIQDIGHGIAEQDLPRVFDPFFTTKPVGRGTGLGLSITEAIVRDHDGSIGVANAPEGGAVFTIVLPSAKDGAGAA